MKRKYQRDIDLGAMVFNFYKIFFISYWKFQDFFVICHWRVFFFSRYRNVPEPR